MMKRRAFITLIDGAAAAVCSRTRAAALPTDRAICNAGVPHAIGQSFDWLVSAEAELLGARGIPTICRLRRDLSVWRSLWCTSEAFGTRHS
jgi:hypothetical protein